MKDRTEVQSQRVQKVDYNRLKHDRAQEVANQQYHNKNNVISPELLEYAYPCHYQSENNYGKISQLLKICVFEKDVINPFLSMFDFQREELRKKTKIILSFLRKS